MSSRPTRAQWHYLDAARRYGHLRKGFAGYRSTVVVRNLEAAGLVRVSWYSADWEIRSVTDAGELAWEAGRS